MNLFSLIVSVVLCCCITLILFLIRIRFSRADYEIPLVITGIVRVGTLGDAVVCLITLGDDAALLFLLLCLPHGEEYCCSGERVEEDAGQLF